MFIEKTCLKGDATPAGVSLRASYNQPPRCTFPDIDRKIIL